MAEQESENKMKKIFSYLPGAIFILTIGLALYISFHNKAVAQDVISKYEPSVVSLRTVIKSNCDEVPEEFGNAESLDIELCKERVRSGEVSEHLKDMIDSAKTDYSKRIRDDGVLYSGGELILNILFGPVRHNLIEKALR